MKTAVLALVLAAGCARPQPVPVRVEVPVPVPCPEPPYLAWPELPVYALTKESRPEEVARAYAVSVERLQSQLWQALRVLDGYRRATPPSAPKAQPGAR